MRARAPWRPLQAAEAAAAQAQAGQAGQRDEAAALRGQLQQAAAHGAALLADNAALKQRVRGRRAALLV